MRRRVSKQRLVLQLTLIVSIVSLVYCLMSTAVIIDVDDDTTQSVLSSRRLSTQFNVHAIHSSTGRRQSLSVDNESAVTSATLTPADRYDYYSGASRHAKDALGEMKFLRRQSEAMTVLDSQLPLIGVNAIGSHDGGSGLTSLSAGMSDNQRLPVPVGRRSQSAAGDTERLRDSGEQLVTVSAGETAVSRW